MEKISFVETPKEIAELMIKLSTIPKNGLVLDTGCGKGVFLEALKEFGYKNCVGIEIDKELYSHCKAKFDEFKIILGELLSVSAKTISSPTMPTLALVKFWRILATLSLLQGHCPSFFKLFSSISTIITLLLGFFSPLII